MAMSLRDALTRHGININAKIQRNEQEIRQPDAEEQKRREQAELDQMYKNAFQRYMARRR